VKKIPIHVKKKKKEVGPCRIDLAQQQMKEREEVAHIYDC
jgi:hypothetical protein